MVKLGEIPYATRENIGCTVDYTAGRNRYMGYLMMSCNLFIQRNKSRS